MASPKGDLPKRGFVQQNLTSTLQPNKPNRGVLLMDVFIITCIFLKSNQKRQKIIFFLLLSQIREGEKKGRSLLRISEMNKENEIIKGQEQRRAPMPCFFLLSSFLLFFFFIYSFPVFSSFPLLAWAPVPIFLFFSFFSPAPATCHFYPLLSFSFFTKRKKERPSSMSFLSHFFSASFQGQKKDSQHSVSSA